jgi:Putative esterase
MNQFSVLLVLVILSSATPVTSLADSKVNLVGNNYTFHSSILEQSRELQVYVPGSFKEKQATNKKYSVLYLLDGHNWFLNAVSLSNLLAQYGEIPELIIVGINTDDSSRYQFFQKKALLRDFLESEVIPFIEQRFPVSDQRMLFGWQYAGALTLDILAKKPSLFSNYLVSSPFPIEGSNMDEFIQGVSQWSKADLLPNKVYLNISANQTEGTVKLGTDLLADYLKKQSIKQFTWDYSEIEPLRSVSLGHRFSPLETLFQGLINYYPDYPVLEFDSVAEFKALGGMVYVKSYYLQRAEKHGFDPEIPEEGWFYLGRLALDANDPGLLSLIVKEMIANGQLDKNNAQRNSSYAKLLANHKYYNEAIAVYRSLIRQLPTEPMLYKRLGDIYRSMQQVELARTNYRQALNLAVKQSSVNLSEHKADLESVR